MAENLLSDRRRRLADELRRLREAAGVSGRQLAIDLGWSQPKVSRAERGQTVPSVDDILQWLERCSPDASEDERRMLRDLATDVHTEVLTHRELNRRGHAEQQRGRILHDADASAIRVYQPEVVPGLLQTANYARLVMLAFGEKSPEKIGESVTARLERQEILYDTNKVIDAVITEPALAWQPGPASVSHQQLHRLLDLAELPTVHIGVVSREAMKHVLPSPSFVLTEWEGVGADVVTESLTAEVVVTDPEGVQAYKDMFRTQQEAAVYGAEAAEVIHRVITDLS